MAVVVAPEEEAEGAPSRRAPTAVRRRMIQPMSFLADRLQSQSAVRKIATLPPEEATELEKAADGRSAKIKRAMSHAKGESKDGKVPSDVAKKIFKDPDAYLSSVEGESEGDSDADDKD